MLRSPLFVPRLAAFATAALVSFAVPARPSGAEDRRVDFDRDVRPILSNRCFTCHGPDSKTRKAELRLDVREGLFAHVEPGKPESSELLRRVHATDEDRMPPKSAGASLEPRERKILERWIREGAEWKQHWAFEVPVRPPVLPAKTSNALHPIDRLVRNRLRTLGVAPSPPADPLALLRRVTFDLTGLPPSTAQLEAFRKDSRRDRYARYVDRLLASPQYGERMAFAWLNAARYSDTDGFQQDATRDNWPWRDWVVDAYNANMPFDRFTREQIAGDLMPKATPEQKLATCFHRNHMTNGEGGRDPAESRVEYVIDRVNTLGTVWLGLTVSCAQCHDHKFDPISQRDYYALSAFFNSIDEDGRAGRRAKPYLTYASKRVAAGKKANDAWFAKQRKAFQRVDASASKDFDAWLTRLAKSLPREHVSYRAACPTALSSRNGAVLNVDDRGVVRVGGPNSRHEDYVLHYRPDLLRITGVRLAVYPVETSVGPRLSLAKDGHALPTNLKFIVASSQSSERRTLAIREARADHEFAKSGYGPVRNLLDDDPRSGWWTKGRDAGETRHAVFALAAPLVLADHETLVIEVRHRSLSGYANLRRFRFEFTGEAGRAAASLAFTPREVLAQRRSVVELRKSERDGLRSEFLADHAVWQRARTDLDAARRQRDRYVNLAKNKTRVMVLAERKKPRKTHVLLRGVWNQHGERVMPALPAAFRPDRAKAQTRMDLADWICAASNPLTARVAVNRYWQMFFGRGLVRTAEDFGVQGERPLHQDVLDWLSVDFVESGWDVKKLVRTIVMSATYRQSSDVRAELAATDPENRMLARQSRFRLPSWMIRDAALAASGLLVRRLGGPPVFPPQPGGVWADSTMGRLRYVASVGPDRDRRSLYTFWRRLIAPTLFFDEPKRRVCRVRRVVTNTPTQALALMNDESMVDAAHALARAVLAIEANDDRRIEQLVTRVLTRAPDDFERSALRDRLRAFRIAYASRPDDARQIASRRGFVPRRAAELAAWTMLSNLVLNLDEALVRP